MTATRIEPQRESCELTLTTRPLAPTQAGRCEQLAQELLLGSAMAGN